VRNISIPVAVPADEKPPVIYAFPPESTAIARGSAGPKMVLKYVE
jgi:hypothetical protein